jgi:anaerobic magnesium-protoporphyrin IX monomethyl ester cyclase
MYDTTRKFSFPPIKNADLDAQISYAPPLGLLYLASSLENNGHTVEIIDCFFEDKPEQTIQRSLDSTDAVGLSVFTDYVGSSVRISNLIKEKDPDIPVIIGGPHVTFHPNKAFADIPSADFAMEGEGEYSIIELMKALQGSEKFSQVPGIYYRDHGEIKTGKPPTMIENLDLLPFPARHLVDKYEYGKLRGVYFRKPKFTSFLTSRGCPFHCRFCNHIVLRLQKYRERSIDNVLDEFQQISENHSSVYIVDDTFFTNEKRVAKIMDGLIELGSNFEIYILGGRVGVGEKDLFEKMKKAGVKFIFFGLESGSQDLLDYYKKEFTLDQIRKTIHLAHEMDMYTAGSFIFGAPFETKEHFERTIKFACSLPLDTTYWHLLKYEYSSRLWNEAVKRGLIDSNTDAPYVIADLKRGLCNFSREELEKYCKKAFVRFYFRPHYLIKEFAKVIRKKDFVMLKAGLGLA